MFLPTFTSEKKAYNLIRDPSMSPLIWIFVFYDPKVRLELNAFYLSSIFVYVKSMIVVTMIVFDVTKTQCLR